MGSLNSLPLGADPWNRHGLCNCLLHPCFPVSNRVIVFSFFALCFSESIFNSLFHSGATAIFGVYCPGLITALILYPPLFWYLSRVAYHAGLLTDDLGLLAFAVARVIHTADVATSVFGVEWSSFRRT